MNKKLMALAVASAIAPGLAVAQTSNTPTSIVPSPGVASSNGITLYGRLDETIMYDKYGQSVNNGVGQVSSFNKSDVYSPGNAVGFRGREDLGGGTSAWFQLEMGAWPSERLDTATITGNNWGGRNSAIGVSSGLGDIFVGIWDTPYKQTFGVWNSVTSGGFSAAGITMGQSDSTGTLNNALCAGVVNNGTGTVTTGAQGACVTEASISSTAFSRRLSDSVQYWTPIMSGVQAKVAAALAPYQSPGSTAAGAGQSLPKPKEYSASVAWAQGPLSVGVGYDFHQGLRPNTAANGIVDAKDTAVQVGAKWHFGMGEIGVGYEQITWGNTSTTIDTGMKVPAYVVNGRWNIGPGAIWGQYSGAEGKSCANSTNIIGTAACGIKVKMYALGYDYVMSKRTKMYVAYAKIDNGMATNSAGVQYGSSYYYIAGPAANTTPSAAFPGGQGTNGGLAQGTDVTTIGVGIQHVF